MLPRRTAELDPENVQYPMMHLRHTKSRRRVHTTAIIKAAIYLKIARIRNVLTGARSSFALVSTTFVLLINLPMRHVCNFYSESYFSQRHSNSEPRYITLPGI